MLPFSPIVLSIIWGQVIKGDIMLFEEVSVFQKGTSERKGWAESKGNKENPKKEGRKTQLTKQQNKLTHIPLENTSDISYF